MALGTVTGFFPPPFQGLSPSMLYELQPTSGFLYFALPFGFFLFPPVFFFSLFQPSRSNGVLIVDCLLPTLRFSPYFVPLDFTIFLSPFLGHPLPLFYIKSRFDSDVAFGGGSPTSLEADNSLFSLLCYGGSIGL